MINKDLTSSRYLVKLDHKVFLYSCLLNSHLAYKISSQGSCLLSLLVHNLSPHSMPKFTSRFLQEILELNPSLSPSRQHLQVPMASSNSTSR